MSQDDKPIFPRSTESSEEEKQRLRREARLNLENEERQFDPNLPNSPPSACKICRSENRPGAKFCITCGASLAPDLPKREPPPYEPPASIMYGPPPMMVKDEQHEIHTTMYGPPPMMMDKPKEYPAMPMYGLPPIMLDEKYKPPVLPAPPVMPMYGPPPMPVKNDSSPNYLLWGGIIAGALVLITGLVVLLVFLYFISTIPTR